jgi:DNA sulfur modification protein DndE
MKFSNIRLSERTQNIFGRLKGTTGLTPNLLARYAICLSIKEKSEPSFEEFGNDKGSMIEPAILFGEYEPIFLGLMKNRMKKDSIPDSKLNETTRLHINRGAVALSTRIKDIGDFAELINENRNV